MSERVFRVVLGGALAVIAWWGHPYAFYGYMAFVLFEGITNLRAPKLVALVTGKAAPEEEEGEFKFRFEAERALRLAIAVILAATLFLSPEYLWWAPWFVAFMLVMAGVTGVCPMRMFFRAIGFR